MMRTTHVVAALRRSSVVLALVALSASSAFARQTTDTAKKKPATKTVPPPATKTVARPDTKTATVTAITPPPAPATKTVNPPQPAVTKTATQPPAVTKTATQAPAVTKTATQPVTTAKTSPPATKTVPPPPVTKTAAPGTKTQTPPQVQPTAPANKPIVLPPAPKQAAPPKEESIIDRLKRLVGLGPKPAPPTVTTKTVTTPPRTTPVAGSPAPVTPPTKTAVQQTKTPANQTGAGATKTVASTPQTKAAPGPTKTAAPPPAQTPAGAAPGTRRLDVVTSDTAIAKPLIIMREVFAYDQAGRRDPFVSLLTTNDLRPTLSDLVLLGTVVDEPGRSIALLMDNSVRKQVTVKVGQRLGRMRVQNIRSNVVVFTINEYGMSRVDSLLLRDPTKGRGR